MDSDHALDHNFIKVRDKLKQQQIKLWLPPYLTDNNEKNQDELKGLAAVFSEELSLPVDVCLLCINQLQEKAISNLKERETFRATGQASLKVKVPNNDGGRTLTVSIELNKTGLSLREDISKAISVPLERLRIIAKGMFVKDDLTLESQGIKHGLHMMAIVLKESSDSIIPKYESHVRQLDSTKADIELVSKSQYLQVADQTGKLLKLPIEERRSLIKAMTLHEKGRSALKKDDFAFALTLLLEAEKEFRQCNSSLLKSVDNYGVLSLDIVWCYLNLQSLAQLPDALDRLRQCEASFEQSYGSNLERLTALKGSTGNESALFMRLHLLQGIAFYHQNQMGEAQRFLARAEEELKSLQVDDDQLSQLCELGYKMRESRMALRAAKGDLNEAVAIIEKRRSDKKRNEQLEALERKLKKKRKKLGKCVNGDWIDPTLHTALMSMGFSYDTSKWALAQTNNNINAGINLINESMTNVGPSESSTKEPASSSEKKDKSDVHNILEDALVQVISMGFDPDMARLALKKFKGDVQKATEELLGSGGTIDPVDSNSDDDSSGDSSSDEEGGPSSVQVKKQRAEAYTRLREGLADAEDDHLDLNLVLEMEFLQRYKELLSKS